MKKLKLLAIFTVFLGNAGAQNDEAIITARFNEQSEFLLSYIASPMWFKHRQNEFSYQAKLMFIGSETKEVDSILAKSEQEIRYDRVCTAQYLVKESSIFSALTSTGENADTSFLALYFWEKVQEEIEIIPKQGVYDSSYISPPGWILFLPNASSGAYMTCPIHELTHRSTDGNTRIARGAIIQMKGKIRADTFLTHGLFLNTRTGTIYGYSDSPTEVAARLNALRYILYRDGIYDPRYEEFKEEYIGPASFYTWYIFYSDVYGLFKRILIDKQDLVWLMNNVD